MPPLTTPFRLYLNTDKTGIIIKDNATLKDIRTISRNDFLPQPIGADKITLERNITTRYLYTDILDENGVAYGATREDVIEAISNFIGLGVQIVVTNVSVPNLQSVISQDSSTTRQLHTVGATVTISNNTRRLIVNPASILAALTITMPAVPYDEQQIVIAFGGTIRSGIVITSLSIQGNTGQTILSGDVSNDTTIVVNNLTVGSYTLQYDLINNEWIIL